MKIINAVAFAFSNPKTRTKTVLYALGLFVVLGIPTALLSNPVIPYVRMIPATPLDYAFLFATSLLAAVYLALPEDKASQSFVRSVMSEQQRSELHYKNKTCKTGKGALGGGFLGFISFSCPTCSMLLVFLLGFDFMYNVVNPMRPLFGIISIIVLSRAIGEKSAANQQPK